MKKFKLSSDIISLLPIILAASFITSLIFLFKSTGPAFAFSGGHALDFDGNTDFAELDRSYNLLGTDWQLTKTVSLWVRPMTDGPPESTEVEAGNLIFGDHPRWFGIYQGNLNGQNRIWVWNCDNNIEPEGVGLATIGIPYTVGEWVHISLVHGNFTLSAYKNGVLIESKPSGSTAYGHGAWDQFRFRAGGSIQTGTTGYVSLFQGQIDELRIYSKTLTTEEIRQDMYRTLDGSDPLLGAYYKFDDGSGTTITNHSTNDCNNFGGNGCDGILLDGLPLPNTPRPPDGDTAEWITSGAFAGPRNALDFDGSNDYVSVPADITMPANLTLEAWVYPRDTSSGQKWIAGEASGAQLTMDGPQAQFRIHNGTSLQGPARAMLVANEWQHIAGTYDGTDMRIYVNGVEGTPETFSGSNNDQTDIFAIGSPDGTTLQNNMIVDEVRLWSSAQSPTQIRENMFQTLQGNESGLTAYYRFDQDSAVTGSTTLYDLTSNGNDGTLNNMDPATDWVPSTAFNTWIGSESADWTAGENWSCYTAPSSTDNAGIYYHSASNPPTIGTSVSVGDLTVAAGGSLNVNSSGGLSVAGNLFNHGTLTQIQNVDSSGSVDFFNTGGYGGLTINSENQDLGDTTVTIRGNQNCTTTMGETVERCFDISPTSSPGNGTTLTFFFDSDELSGNTCENLDVFHWDSGVWSSMTLDTSYGTLGRICGSNPRSVQVTEATGYSPFVLKENEPNAIALENFSGKPASISLMLMAGILILITLPIGILAKKQIKR